MRTYLIKIGNSQGVRLPKLLIEQVGLGKQVEIEAQPHQLVIRPVAQVPRQAWDEQFKAMAEQGDDQLLDADTVSSSHWDNDEWEW